MSITAIIMMVSILTLLVSAISFFLYKGLQTKTPKNHQSKVDSKGKKLRN